MDLRADAPREIRRRSIVHGNNDNAPKCAAEKCGGPFRRILPPEQDAVALGKASAIQLLGEGKSLIQNLAVCDLFRPVSAPLGVRPLICMRSKMLQKEFGDRFSHGQGRNRDSMRCSFSTSLVQRRHSDRFRDVQFQECMSGIRLGFYSALPGPFATKLREWNKNHKSACRGGRPVRNTLR